MHQTPLRFRLAASLLVAALGLPPPAWGLRTQGPEGAGLEEVNRTLRTDPARDESELAQLIGIIQDSASARRDQKAFAHRLRPYLRHPAHVEAFIRLAEDHQRWLQLPVWQRDVLVEEVGRYAHRYTDTQRDPLRRLLSREAHAESFRDGRMQKLGIASTAVQGLAYLADTPARCEEVLIDVVRLLQYPDLDVRRDLPRLTWALANVVTAPPAGEPLPKAIILLAQLVEQGRYQPPALVEEVQDLTGRAGRVITFRSRSGDQWLLRSADRALLMRPRAGRWEETNYEDRKLRQTVFNALAREPRALTEFWQHAEAWKPCLNMEWRAGNLPGHHPLYQTVRRSLAARSRPSTNGPIPPRLILDAAPPSSPPTPVPASVRVSPTSDQPPVSSLVDRFSALKAEYAPLGADYSVSMQGRRIALTLTPAIGGGARRVGIGRLQVQVEDHRDDTYSVSVRLDPGKGRSALLSLRDADHVTMARAVEVVQEVFEDQPVQAAIEGWRNQLASSAGPQPTKAPAGLEERATLEQYREAFLVPRLELEATGLRVKDNRSGLTAFVRAADGHPFEGFIPKSQTSSYQRDLQYLAQRGSCSVAVTKAEVVTGNPPKLHLTFTVLDEPMRARRAVLNTVPAGSVVRATIQFADPNGLYGAYEGVGLFVPLQTVTEVVGRKPFNEWPGQAIEGVVQEIDWARGRLTLTFTRLAPLESASTTPAALSAAPPGTPTLHRLVKAHRILSGANPQGFEAMVTTASGSGWSESALDALFRAGRTFLTHNPGYPADGLVENLRIGIIELDLPLDEMLELLREATNVDHIASPDYDAGDDHLSVTLFRRQQRLTAAETGLEEAAAIPSWITSRVKGPLTPSQITHALELIKGRYGDRVGYLHVAELWFYPDEAKTTLGIRRLNDFADILAPQWGMTPKAVKTILIAARLAAKYDGASQLGSQQLVAILENVEMYLSAHPSEQVERQERGAAAFANLVRAGITGDDATGILEMAHIMMIRGGEVLPPSAPVGLEERLTARHPALNRGPVRPSGLPGMETTGLEEDQQRLRNLQQRVQELAQRWEHALQMAATLETRMQIIAQRIDHLPSDFESGPTRGVLDWLQNVLEQFKRSVFDFHHASASVIRLNVINSDIAALGLDDLRTTLMHQQSVANQLLPAMATLPQLARQIPVEETWADARTRVIDAADELVTTMTTIVGERLTARPGTERSGDVLRGSTAVLAPVYARGNLPYAVIVEKSKQAEMLEELGVPASQIFVEAILGEAEASEAAYGFLRGLGVTQFHVPHDLRVGHDAVEQQLYELFTLTFERPTIPSTQDYLRDLVLQAQHAFQA